MSVNVKEVIPMKWDDSKLISHDSLSSRYNRANILKNYENFEGIFEIIIEFSNGEYNVELETNVGITNSFITAVECLGASLYAPSLLFASTTIEIILNHDLRLDDHRKISHGEWLNLNKGVLKYAYKRGLPTNLLLETNESLDNSNIRFVDWRNKIAHGDTEGYRKTQTGSHTSKSHTSTSHVTVSWQPEREHAIDQIKKVQQFVEAWGKTNPKLRLH